MKKFSFVLLMALSATCLFACNSPSSVKGQFLDKEYILSLEQEKDFFDQLTIKGVEKEKVTLVSSNEKILASDNGEDFTARSSGSAYIFAKYKNKTVAKTKVNVKYKLSSPQNFNLSSNVLTWDKSFVVVNGQKVVASEYQFEVGQIVDINSDVTYEKVSPNLKTNSYTFSKTGSFSVKITALSSNKHIDNSEEVVKIFHNGVMGEIANSEIDLNLGTDYGSQVAEISWAERGHKVNAIYDVYVEGFKIASDIEEEKFTFDYSIYSGEKPINVEIVAKDNDPQQNEKGIKESTTTKLQINILEKPDITYSFTKEGKLVWTNDENASLYKLKITDYEGNTTYKDVTDKANLEEVLASYSKNIYDVQAVAIGGKNENGFYVSSKPSEVLRTAKLPIPKVELSFDGTWANLAFAEDDYVTEYKISYASVSVYYSTTLGTTARVNLAGMAVGKHNFEVVALPKADTINGGASAYSYKSDQSKLVLNSDPVSVDFYVLGNIGTVTHILNGSTSTFTFSAVENANFYNLFVNGVKVDANIYEANGIVVCELENLKNFTPSNDGYDIKVVAGRKDLATGNEIAIRSEKTKRLKILDTPTEKSYSNGNFAWNDISTDCLYSYEVYKTGSDYTLTTGQAPVLSESEVDALKISQTLEEGYYKIKVKSISIDENFNLDSDFNDKDNVLEVDFLVTKQIESPSAVFAVDGEEYKLTISTVENASLYKVYVDGTLDGQVSSEGLAQEVYVFNDDFKNVGKHEVKVQALAGNRYDKNIYLDSSEFILNVNRISLPEHTVNISYTDFDVDNHQWLTIKEIKNTTNVEFFLNGNAITGEAYRLDLVDYATYGTEFKIGLILKAGSNNGNDYYIDSHLKEIDFVRADYPTDIKYTDGNVTWTQNQADAEKNKISMIVDLSETSDYYKRFDLEINPQSYNLQGYINTLVATDLGFATAYRQVSKLQIKMLSYMNKENGEKFYLPSFYGTTLASGTNTLDIFKLASPELSFDVDTKVISWTSDVENSVFDIYIDDVLKVKDYSLSSSISLSELDGVDFTSQKKITIRAKHSNYLDSDISSPIYIKQLVTPNSLTIAKDGNDYRASVLITKDSANVDSVNVNGSAENVTYTTGGNIASFLLSDFDGTTNFAINLIAKNEGTLNYYISSLPITYTLASLADEEFESNIALDSISWTSLGGDLSGNDIFPIRYVLTMVNNGKTFTKTYQNETFVLLSDLETIAGQKLTGEITVSLKAIVSEDYKLTATAGSPKGYYGQILSESLTTHKLDEVSDLSVQTVDGAGDTEIERKLNSTFKISFADKWSSFPSINFSVNVNDAENPLVLHLPATGVTHTLYTFAKVGENYEFTLSSQYVKSLTPGEIDCTIRVDCEKEISSEVYSFSINKFEKTSGASLTDDGILSIDDSQSSASYLVEIKIEDKTIEKSILLSEGIDSISLMTEEFILKLKGAFTIKILTFDENSIKIPAEEIFEISGYKLEGIENIYIDDLGNINFIVYMDDLSEIVFSARIHGFVKEIQPKLIEGTENHFYITMLELLDIFSEDITIYEDEYTFKFTVKNKGSINAEYKEITFNYAVDETPVLTRGRDLSKDYIIFNPSTKSDTSAFRVELRYTKITEELDDEGNVIGTISQPVLVIISYPASVSYGYWVTDLNGENAYFASERGAETDLIYTECYAVCLNDLLAELAYGQVKIKIARIGKNGDVYYQYNSTEFEAYKLNKINDQAGEEGSLIAKDNFLSFTWTQKDNSASAKTPTAYYIDFANADNSIVKRIISYTLSVDLRTVGLNPGEAYYISVMAINVEKGILASDESLITTTLRYTTPIALQVKDGVLTLDQTELENTEFMKDIKDYFIQSTEETLYHNTVGTKQYTLPYYFTPNLLADLNVTLRFTKLDASGGITNQVYEMTVKGATLFPDFEIDFNLAIFSGIGLVNKASYLTLLNIYSALKLAEDVTTEAIYTKSMIDALISSPRGIGDDAVLFDDIGRNIPAGAYSVSIIQTKSNQYIESQNGRAVQMYLTAAPEISLPPEGVDHIEDYKVDLTPAKTMIFNGTSYQLGVATRYKMTLRQNDIIGTAFTAGIIEFIIQHDGSEWSIEYVGVSGSKILEGVISNNANVVDGVAGFTINMSALRRQVNDFTGDTTIPANLLMKADIFAYDQDNVYVLNGKSAIFNVRYLDLQAGSIFFENGKFILRSTPENNFEIYIKYKRASQGATSKTAKFENGEAVIEFERSGLYEYVVLSLKGSVSANTMNVESSSYAITNLYKLNAPTLTTSNSNLVIDYNSADTSYMNTLSFNMGNNVSLAEGYDEEDKGYYYYSPITASSVVAPYVVGSAENDGNVHESEFSATEFHAYLNGNGGTFTLSEHTPAMADYLLVFDKDYVVMNSDISVLKAKMLNEIDSIEILEGHIVYSDEYEGKNILTDSAKTNESGVVVYEVAVEYYIPDNDPEGDRLLSESEVFYTVRQEGLKQIFSGLNLKERYADFKVAVTLLGGLVSDEYAGNSIQTIEGDYIIIKDSVYYYNDGSHVLRSKTYVYPNELIRTAQPFLAEKSNGVTNGSLQFVIDKSIYFMDEYSADIDTAKRISVYAEYTQAGTTYLTKLTGQFDFEIRMEAGEENNVYVTFTPDEGQLNDVVGAFRVKIYAYGDKTIISNPLIIEEIYKLPNIQERYYNILLNDSDTVIDLANYFSNVNISNDYICYKLVIDFGGEEPVVLTANDNIQTFTIPVGATRITIQSQDAQDTTEASPKKLLYSDTKVFDLKSTVAYEDTNPLIDLKWNSQEMRFEWSWKDGRTGNFEYFVSITTVDEKTLKSSTITETVTTDYYLPKDRGFIANGAFTIRARQLSDAASTDLYKFSDIVYYNGEEVLYNLFSGGNGTKANPYLIKTKADFLNMSKRNRSDFYFKLDANDISISTSDLYQIVEIEGVTQIVMTMQDFDANFDGNGFTIEIVSADVFALSEAYKPNLTGKANLSMNEYSALFRNISSSATIKNLFVNYVIDYQTLNNSKIMFSPLGAFNYGTIDNVKVVNFTITNLGGIGDDNVALVGGIVGVNYGTIKNSINSAEFDYTMAQQLQLTFGYAGIALFNSKVTSYTGRIENCFNQGNKNISVTVNNNLVYLAGISLTNSADISMAGNDGNLTLSSKGTVSSMTGYYGGIVITSNSGTLEYVYNNATIQSTSAFAAFRYGGIAYGISSGSIKYTAVTVAGQPIIHSCTNTPTDLGFNYASADSGTSENIATKALSEQSIDCGNGYSFVISQSEGGYKAEIVKNA